jgi:hypothetical protein
MESLALDGGNMFHSSRRHHANQTNGPNVEVVVSALLPVIFASDLSPVKRTTMSPLPLKDELNRGMAESGSTSISPGTDGTDFEAGRFGAVPVQRPDTVVGTRVLTRSSSAPRARTPK